MDCYVREMRPEDIPQVAAVDREAFLTQWPSPNFKHELRNRLAHYIVACDRDRTVELPSGDNSSGKGLANFIHRLKRLFSDDRNPGDIASPALGHYVVGYVGFWYMGGEVHITSIAVREALQRQGIGELLLISTIDMARKLKATTITLEVRVSNTGAQRLYSKYGFNKVGVRKGYYTDNREDGVVMTTDDINSPRFLEQLRQLKQAHGKKWGIDTYRITR